MDGLAFIAQRSGALPSGRYVTRLRGAPLTAGLRPALTALTAYQATVGRLVSMRPPFL